MTEHTFQIPGFHEKLLSEIRAKEGKIHVYLLNLSMQKQGRCALFP